MRTEDGSIIHRCLNGKPEAFGMLVDKYKEGVYAYVYNELRNLHDAQDVTQEVFLQAYRDLRSLRKWESFAFWLHRIAYRRCMDFLHRESNIITLLPRYI
jgi:RNA polymerase sigma-70 factor (ECF subfamily)